MVVEQGWWQDKDDPPRRLIWQSVRWHGFGWHCGEERRQKCPKDVKAHLTGKEAKGRERWLDRSPHRPAGNTFSPSRAVARASEGGSWPVAAVEGGCGSGRLPAPEVSVCAHGDKRGKFQAPRAPAWQLCIHVWQEVPAKTVAHLKSVFFCYDTELSFLRPYFSSDLEHGLEHLKFTFESCFFS